jgi:hypothetical protein
MQLELLSGEYTQQNQAVIPATCELISVLVMEAR